MIFQSERTIEYRVFISYRLQETYTQTNTFELQYIYITIFGAALATHLFNAKLALLHFSMGAAASAFECLLPIVSFLLLAAYHYKYKKDSDREVPITFIAHGLMSRERAIQHCIEKNDRICLVQAYRCSNFSRNHRQCTCLMLFHQKCHYFVLVLVLPMCWSRFFCLCCGSIRGN